MEHFVTNDGYAVMEQMAEPLAPEMEIPVVVLLMLHRSSLHRPATPFWDYEVVPFLRAITNF